MSVFYKFKSTSDVFTLFFDGFYISVADSKKNIMKQQKFKERVSFEFRITKAKSKEKYEDDSTMIPKNSLLVISTVPLTVPQKRNRDSAEFFLQITSIIMLISSK
ncbi:hypothetical protein TKK_0002346 [Trichogramma kaykai]